MKRHCFSDYIVTTEFAVKQLFSAYRYYQKLLSQIVSNSLKLGQGMVSGFKISKSDLSKHKKLTDKYFDLYFSQSIIAGSIVQIAHQAIENFSQNNFVPESCIDLGIQGDKVKKFCIGNIVKGVPEGLIVYATRNQHFHCFDREMMRQTRVILQKIAIGYTVLNKKTPALLDPAFDLSVRRNESLAPDALVLLGITNKTQFKKFIKRILGHG